MKYVFADYSDVLASQCRMVRKLYPSFDENTDYCFWLIPDMYEDSLLSLFSGCVNFYDKNHRKWYPGFAPKADFCIRTPYPNKNMKQIGVKIGSKRTFGVPVVLHDVSHFQDLAVIEIEWIALLMEMNELPRLLLVKSQYLLDWDLSDCEKNHWFTLDYRDCWKQEVLGQQAQWYDSVSYVTDGICTEDGLDFSVAGNRRLYPVDESMLRLMFRDNQEMIQCFIQWAEQSDFVKSVMFPKHEKRIKVDGYVAEKRVTLQAAPYADLIPEKVCGFK